MEWTSSPSDALGRLGDSRAYDGRNSATSLGRGRAGHLDGAGAQGTDTNGVDRNTSVRSVMTLPAYSVTARANEKIVAREGERAGVDTVVEYPEDDEEGEARREEEMASLYQIRVARREQTAARRAERDAREERRRLRREARARGDETALRELRRASRRARHDSNSALLTSQATPEELMAEHQSRERGRRVSSVNYAELGVARHDGSRVRGDSTSSDHRPLLDGAAGMGNRSVSADIGRPRADSRLSGIPYGRPASTLAGQRSRNVSTSSLSRFITPSPDYSDSERSSLELDMVPTPFAESHNRSRSGSRARSSTGTRQSRLRIDSADLSERSLSRSRLSSDTFSTSFQTQPRDHSAADTQLPTYDDLSPIADRRPTNAETTEHVNEHTAQHPLEQTARTTSDEVDDEERGEAPPYESPIRNGAAPRLAGLGRLPSIHVTPFSPFGSGDSPTTARPWVEEDR